MSGTRNYTGKLLHSVPSLSITTEISVLHHKQMAYLPQHGLAPLGAYTRWMPAAPLNCDKSCNFFFFCFRIQYVHQMTSNSWGSTCFGLPHARVKGLCSASQLPWLLFAHLDQYNFLYSVMWLSGAWEVARVIREAHFKFVVILTGVLKYRSLRVATHWPVHHREKYTAVAFVGSDQTTLFTEPSFAFQLGCSENKGQ